MNPTLAGIWRRQHHAERPLDRQWIRRPVSVLTAPQVTHWVWTVPERTSQLAWAQVTLTEQVAQRSWGLLRSNNAADGACLGFLGAPYELPLVEAWMKLAAGQLRCVLISGQVGIPSPGFGDLRK